jgi:RimJ/RimL family protein N-acetyltransferase
MFIIRPLEAADAASFKALRLLGASTSPASMVPTYQEEESRSLDEMAARIRPSHTQTVFGAFVADALIGIVGVRRDPLVQVSHKAVIWGVFVDPAHRRGRIAQQLLHAAAEHASRQWQCVQLTLCVNTENVAARKLYASMGFVGFGVEPRSICVDGRFYDEEHMAKAL